MMKAVLRSNGMMIEIVIVWQVETQLRAYIDRHTDEQ